MEFELESYTRLPAELNNQGAISLQLGKYEEARASFTRALEIAMQLRKLVLTSTSCRGCGKTDIGACYDGERFW